MSLPVLNGQSDGVEPLMASGEEQPGHQTAMNMYMCTHTLFLLQQECPLSPFPPALLIILFFITMLKTSLLDTFCQLFLAISFKSNYSGKFRISSYRIQLCNSNINIKYIIFNFFICKFPSCWMEYTQKVRGSRGSGHMYSYGDSC